MSRNRAGKAGASGGRRARGRFRVLCVAGTDSQGCSGLAADLRTVAALGGHGMPAVTAVTAQDSRGVLAVAPVSPHLVRAQIATALEDAGAEAVKIGMLAAAPVVRAVAAALIRRGSAPVVLDPVLRATTGGALLDDAGLRLLVTLLLPLADLVTPNLPEAEALLGHPIRGLSAMEDAARQVRELGARAVLLKGGHRRGEAVDIFADAGGTMRLRAPRVATNDTRGTGCVLSTACACFLAEKIPLPEAVVRAKAFVTDAIRHSYPLGRGRGPVNPIAARRPPTLSSPP